jgi:hypothetical protein
MAIRLAKNKMQQRTSLHYLLAYERGPFSTSLKSSFSLDYLASSPAILMISFIFIIIKKNTNKIPFLLITQNETFLIILLLNHILPYY